MSKFGVQGTPTVFINGKKWERSQNAFVLDEFKSAVEAG
jgi:protein-disulfide isomerase